MTPIPPPDDRPEIQEPTPGSPNPPSETPIDTPQEVPERREPDWRPPGSDDAPMRMPGENPDVETEI
jgi:hypothetical protein